MLGIATDLSRAKMYEIEETLLKDGFQDTDSVKDDRVVHRRGLARAPLLVQDRARRAAEPRRAPGAGEGPEQTADDRARAAPARAARSARASAARSARASVRISAPARARATAQRVSEQRARRHARHDRRRVRRRRRAMPRRRRAARFIQSQYAMFQAVLKVSIRKVTLTVTWKVLGRDRDLTTVAFFTDPSAMDKVLMGLGSVDLDSLSRRRVRPRLGLEPDHHAGEDHQVRRRRAQAGLTLLEVMIASAIMVVMMALAWRTIRNTSEARRTFEKYEERNHELRMAMGRVVADFESLVPVEERGRRSSPPAHDDDREGWQPSARHPVLDAGPPRAVGRRERVRADRDPVPPPRATRRTPALTNWIRREQRRESNLPPEEEPADYDILVHDIQAVKFEFFNWKTISVEDSLGHDAGRRPARPAAEPRADHDHRQDADGPRLQAHDRGADPDAGAAEFLAMKKLWRFLTVERGPKRRPKPRRSQRGIALIMVLIAIGDHARDLERVRHGDDVDTMAAANYRDRCARTSSRAPRSTSRELVIRLQQRLDNIKILRGQVQITDFADQLDARVLRQRRGGPGRDRLLPSSLIKGLGADIGTCGFDRLDHDRGRQDQHQLRERQRCDRGHAEERARRADVLPGVRPGVRRPRRRGLAPRSRDCRSPRSSTTSTRTRCATATAARPRTTATRASRTRTTRRTTTSTRSARSSWSAASTTGSGRCSATRSRSTAAARSNLSALDEHAADRRDPLPRREEPERSGAAEPGQAVPARGDGRERARQFGMTFPTLDDFIDVREGSERRRVAARGPDRHDGRQRGRAAAVTLPGLSRAARSWAGARQDQARADRRGTGRAARIGSRRGARSTRKQKNANGSPVFPPIRSDHHGRVGHEGRPQNVTEAPGAERRVGVPEGRVAMASRVFAVDLGAWSVKLAIASPGLRGATLLSVDRAAGPAAGDERVGRAAREGGAGDAGRGAAPARRDRLHRRLRRPGVHAGPRVRLQEPAPRRARQGGRRRARGRRAGRSRGHGLLLRADPASPATRGRAAGRDVRGRVAPPAEGMRVLDVRDAPRARGAADRSSARPAASSRAACSRAVARRSGSSSARRRSRQRARSTARSR